MEKTYVAKADRSIEDIILLYDDGSVKRLDKGMVVHFKEDDPESSAVGMTVDLLETTKEDLGIIMAGVLQFGVNLGMFDDPVFDGEED